MMRVAIQHAADTGRFHPAYYKWAPMPGPGALTSSVQRFKSGAHHTDGFERLDAARAFADEMAGKIGVSRPEDGWPVRGLDCAGPDVWIVDEGATS